MKLGGPDATLRHVGRSGWVDVTVDRTETGSVARVKIDRYGGVELVAPLLRDLDAAAAQGPLEVFYDLSSTTGYDAETRHLLTSWLRFNEERLGSTYVLVGSRMLAVGIAAANLSLGVTLVVFTSSAHFDRQLEKRVPLQVPAARRGAA